MCKKSEGIWNLGSLNSGVEVQQVLLMDWQIS
jgi:hypothetical protein